MRLFWKKRFFGIFLKTFSNRIFWPEFVPKIGQKGFPKGKMFFWQKHFFWNFFEYIFSERCFFAKNIQKNLGIVFEFFWKIIFPTGSETKFFWKENCFEIILKKRVFWKRKWFLHYFLIFLKNFCATFFEKLFF